MLNKGVIMSEFKRVETPNVKPESRTVRQFKLGVRNFINKYTGQDDLIVKYYMATKLLATASDNSQSPEFKKQIGDVLQSVEGGEWVTDGAGIWKQGTFNPYTPFQKKALRQKVMQLNAAIKNFGISR